MSNVPTLTVCRGCCCGADTTADPAPAVLLDQLRTGCGGAARIRTSDCLGPCERSDVVVVAPSRTGRAGGARTVWVARVTSSPVVEALSAWVAEGGPGVVEAPPTVRARVFRVERTGDLGPGHSGPETERTERT
jgi:(2Fe-2S) ferredoxin